jgi:8-oxo-dGTP pyrophosphatase MutT (NUDIX family)
MSNISASGSGVSRAELIRNLERYQPFDPKEREMRERFLEFVRAHPDCFERALGIGHVTGSAWILDLERRHVLLTHHYRLNKWMQLGGHSDGDSDTLAVALREAHEESGLDQIRSLSDEIFDLDIHEIPKRGNEPAHLHYDIRFLLEADRRQPLTITEESKDLAWAALDEIARFSLEESILRLARKTVRWLKQPIP